MGLFDRKKKEVIPDVPQPTSYQTYQSSSRSGTPNSAAPSYRSTAPSYVPPSQGGGGYGGKSHWSRDGPSQQAQQPQGGPKTDQRYGVGGGSAADVRRAELLKNAPSRSSPSPATSASSYGGANRDRYGGGESQNGYGDGNQQQNQAVDEEDEEVEGIKQQMRFVKQESLASTRNAVRIAREAEETARATFDKLGEQSDRLTNTEHHLDLAKAHNERAVDETKELEALNRSIFRPNFNINKSAKRDKEEARLLARHNAEKAEREDLRREQYEQRTRMDSTYREMDRQAEDAIGARNRARARGAERARYQFEATASDDEVEDEIDDNLQEISGVVGRLKTLALASGQEVDSQNQRLSKLNGKVDTLDNAIHRSTQRMARIK